MSEKLFAKMMFSLLYIIRQLFIPFSKNFFSETAWPIKAKFYVDPPYEGGTKVCINGSGHMIKIAATPEYGINIKKSSTPETKG